MENFNENVIYLIVEFDEDGKKYLDLVPRKWVTENLGEFSCRYPNKSASGKLKKWIKQLKEPEEDWENYPVTKVVGEARYYEQGMRRLERSMNDLESIVSTDSETNNKDAGVPVASNSKIQKILFKDNVLPVLDRTLDEVRSLVSPENLGTLPNNVENNSTYVLRGEKYDPIDQLKDHMDKRLDQLEALIVKSVESAKRSILYDLDKKINEIKLNLNFSSNGPMQAISAARKVITTPLPITELEAFIEFDKNLKINEGQRDALKTVLTSLIMGLKDVKADIGHMIPAIIGKPVQVLYSGCGRKTKTSEGKLNFSATETFTCIKEVLEDKWTQRDGELQILSNLSRWLSGAGDREGGRRDRK